jgi:catechol 2,3-dioxygenase-like lactoylglutathione lyase family enzyme
VATYLHTMLRITDPQKSRAFYEALGFTFSRDMEIVRNGELEATNYSRGDARAAPGARHRARARAVPGA